MSVMSARLQGAGMSTLSPRGATVDGGAPSIEDMERRLARYSRRPETKINGYGSSGGAHTARTLLEENQRLSQKKKDNDTLERQASRELIDQIFERDRQNLEHDRKKQQKRRQTHQELAQKYKSAIVQKELQQAQEYNKKLGEGGGEEFFPFVEGETVEMHRENQNTVLRTEMRDFLKHQKTDQPPRKDALLTSVSNHHHSHYPVHHGTGILPSKKQQVPGSAGVVAPHIGGKHPLFLSRNREHMSRRINDDHVRRAMTDKVELCKAQLEQLALDRHREARSHEEGLMINDALRYDNALIKATERQKNAEFLRGQIEERRNRAQNEKKESRQQCAGYWGPEEKDLQAQDIHQDHCRALISQMEVDQHRRLDDQHRRLQQEKKIVQNSMNEMAVDRMKAVEKADRQKKVLTQTWNNQSKIRTAMKVVDNIGA